MVQRIRKPASNRPARRTTRTTRRRTSKKSLFKRIPGWALWLGGIVVAAVYVAVFYHFFVDPFSFRWQALYGDATYPEGYSIQGIDISHHQGEIDWDLLRNAQINGNPVRFVIIKATEGRSLLDENFNDNFYQARENSFIRGAYHFFSPSVPAKEQAEYFLKQVHLEEGDLPPVLDIESIGSLTATQVAQAARTWLDIVEKAYGVKPIIYTNYKFKLSYLHDKAFDEYPYWIAHYYVKELKYKGPWKFWQHTDCGRLPGIKERVDFNIYNGSMYDLKKLTIGSKEDYDETE